MMVDLSKSLRLRFLVASAALFTLHANAADYEGTVADYVQINQLMAQYAYTLDNWDANGWASTFTEDGVFHMRERCIIGRDQLSALITRMAPSYTEIPPQQHVTVLGPINYVDENNAWVHSAIMIIGTAGFIRPYVAGVGISFTSAYDDVLKRVDGRWMIAHRSENTTTANYQPPAACPEE